MTKILAYMKSLTLVTLVTFLSPIPVVLVANETCAVRRSQTSHVRDNFYIFEIFVAIIARYYNTATTIGMLKELTTTMISISHNYPKKEEVLHHERKKHHHDTVSVGRHIML